MTRRIDNTMTRRIDNTMTRRKKTKWQAKYYRET
jgi:hypothetical protein